MPTPPTPKQAKVTPPQIEPTIVPARPIAARKMSSELGGSGTNLYTGILSEDHDSMMNGATAFQIFDQMRRSDAQIRATLHAMELPIRTTRWWVTPASDEDSEVTPEAKEQAQFIEKVLFKGLDRTWDSFLHDVLTMFAFGVSVFEKVYRVDEDDKITLRKLAWRKPTTIQQWQTSTGEPGIRQILPSQKVDGDNAGRNDVDVPAAKLVIFTHQREGDNYEGISVLRSAYKHWKIKNTLYLFDNLRHERTSVGLPVITLPQTATDAQREDALAIVQSVRSADNSGVVLPHGYTFTFETPGKGASGGTSDLFESINHHNREIAKNILAQFLELGNTESGSRALSEDQSSLFMFSLTAMAKYIAETINRYVIPELIDLNYNDVTDYPELKFDRLGDVDYQQFAAALSQLVTSGVVTSDDDLERHVREVFNLPPMQTKDEDGEPMPPRKRNAKDAVAEPEPDKTDDIPSPEEIKAEAATEACEHAHQPEDDEAHRVFKEICASFDNAAIIRLQNEARTPEDLARLKKKSFCFNDYEPQASRPLTFAERRVNFSALKRALDSFSDQLDERLATVDKKIREDILLQVKEAVRKNDTAALGMLKARYRSDLSQELTDVQKEMFEIGKRGAATEMGVTMPPTKAEVKGIMRVQNDVAIDTALNDIEGYVRATVTENAAKSGGVTNLTPTAAVVAVSSILDSKMPRILNSLKTVATVGSVNMGRASIFERYPEMIYAMQYSAIIDDRTTYHCLSLDGRVVAPGSTEYAAYNPPQHYGCRSVWVEILQDDSFKPEITGIPQSIAPTGSIDDFTNPTQPIALLKNSPAIKVIQQEIADRQRKLDELKQSDAFPNRQKEHQAAIDKLGKTIAGKFHEAARGLVIEILEADGVQFRHGLQS